MKSLLGIDIGGTKLGLGLGDENGNIFSSRYRDNRDTSPDEVLPWIVAEAKSLAAENNLTLDDIEAFGISAPFPADAVRGIMTRPSNNPKWHNVPILDYLKQHLAIDGCFENDANCAALAEWYFGAARGCSDFIYLTWSTGIGGGIIANDRLLRGGKLLSAGELGHICLQLGGRQCVCGMQGCYEAYCGGKAVAMRVQSEVADKPDCFIMREVSGDVSKIDMRVIEAAVRANDEYALKLWDEITTRHAQALGLFINSFNPEKIVLGTMAWAIGDLLVKPVLEKLPAFCWRELLDACDIVYSGLRREISSYAGIAAALNYVREKSK